MTLLLTGTWSISKCIQTRGCELEQQIQVVHIARGRECLETRINVTLWNWFRRFDDIICLSAIDRIPGSGTAASGNPRVSPHYACIPGPRGGIPLINLGENGTPSRRRFATAG